MSTEILQVITDTDRRGAQVFATDLHDAFERAGRSVRTVALAPGRTGGLELPALGDRRMAVSTLRALRRELQSSTVAVAHGSTTLPACAIAAVGTGVPFVYRQISDSRFWAPSGLRRLRVKVALRRAAAVIALWEGSAKTVQEHFGVPGARIHVIPNAVPSEGFGPAASEVRARERRAFGLDVDRPTLLVVGALVPEKGVDIAIDTAGALAETQLLIVGDGPERVALEAQAARIAPGRVFFAGPVSDPERAYAAADVFLLPSRGGDSMPAVVIEAGLCALPVVSTSVEAIPVIVAEGVTGRIVAPSSPSEFIDAVLEVIQMPDKGAALGAAGRARCLQRFDVDRVASEWLSVLAEVETGAGA